jgi:tetratricopeptide (TPR) repeat protein
MDYNEEEHNDASNIIVKYEALIAEQIVPHLDQHAFSRIIMYYMLIGKHQEASAACEIAVEQYPFSPDLLTDYAVVLIQSEDFEHAMEIIERAETLSPNNSELVVYKAMVMDNQGESKEALEYLQERLPLAEFPGMIWHQMAYIHRDLGDYKKAYDCALTGLAYENDKPEAIWTLLIAADNLEILVESAEELEKFIDDDPLNKHLWIGLGTAFHKLNLFEKAIDAYDNAIAIDQRFGEAWLQRGHSFMNLSNFIEAYESYEEACKELKTDAEIYIFLGAAQEHLGNFGQAISFYKESLKIDNQLGDGWYGIGMCLLAQDKYFDSLYFFRQAIKMDENHELYWLGLAEAEYKTGNSITALEAYEMASELDPENVDMWLDWSFILYDQGDYDRALDLVHMGIEELPDEAELWYRAAAYCMGAGRYKEAIGFLENGLILDFDKHETLFEFFTELETQKALYKLIDQYRQKMQ